MSELELLKSSRHKLVGIKQTIKALGKGNLKVAFVAKDAEERVTRPLITLSAEHSIPIIFVESMSALGRACGIEVGAAAAGLLDDADRKK